MRARPSLLLTILAFLLSACGAVHEPAPHSGQGLAYALGAAEGPPRIVPTKAPLQCVPFARQLSGIEIRGDAWTWWRSSAGRYDRSARPEPGAVMVFSSTRRVPLGHLAVVTRVLGPREVLVRHANWLNRGRIHLDTPVRDVSPGNDWSAVRVWYTPGRSLGARTYALSGFILPAERRTLISRLWSAVAPRS